MCARRKRERRARPWKISTRATALALELLDMRAAFLSKLIYQTYNGYVMSQFKKLEQDLRNRGEIKWKHAMHLIRLLLEGVSVLREGFLPRALSSTRMKKFKGAGLKPAPFVSSL